jgi:hypothetical protein
MQNDIFNYLNEFNAKALDATKRLGEINQRVGQRVLEQQLGLANAWVETGTRSLELLGKAKGYQDLVAGEAELVQAYGKQCLDTYRETLDILNEARDEVSGLVEEGVKNAAEKFNEATAEAA